MEATGAPVLAFDLTHAAMIEKSEEDRIIELKQKLSSQGLFNANPPDVLIRLFSEMYFLHFETVKTIIQNLR